MNILAIWLLPNEAAIFYVWSGYFIDYFNRSVAWLGVMKDRLMGGLNTLLMFNLFFVLFCFAWFVIALIGQATHTPLGFDVWYSLWEPVIMPSIGILMAGALLGGIYSWASKKLAKDA